MRLLDITANAHPDGHRIDIAWRYPPEPKDAGVAVVRGRHDYPAAPEDGEPVGGGIGITAVSDKPLHSERTYYYALFPFTGDPPDFRTHQSPEDALLNRTAAMATAPYGFGELLHSLLPAVYHRYDVERGQLRRFLDLPGGELDRLYSHARAALGLLDPLQVDGRLLPLLARWIGWHTDHRLPLATQRNEVRSAPHIYQAIGGIQALDATAAGVTGWTSRTKEFVHNVARTNEPECQTLWSALRDSHGRWSEPTLTSVHFVHDGRPAVVLDSDNSGQLFYHTRRAHGWEIWAKSLKAGKWQPSAPVISRPGIDQHPTAAMQGDTLRLYWQRRAPGERVWRIWNAVHAGEKWELDLLWEGDSDQRTPAAVADDQGGLWLFWLEQEAGTCRLKYNRRDAADWQLATSAVLPSDGEHDACLKDDLFVLFHPGTEVPKLWVFWARQEPAGQDQTRWHIVYRTKQGLDPFASDWSSVSRLTRQDGGDHDRQPAARAAGDDAVELFWSSTRGGGWAIFRNVLDAHSDTWGIPERLFAGAHAARSPLAVDTDMGTLLLHRSNQSLQHGRTASGVTSLDHRYAGTTTVDTRARDRIALYGAFEDPQTYLYDTARSRTGRGHIARDAVGLYLAPRTESPEEIQAAVSRLAGVLDEFMPMSARPVFITE
ncbi:hypothetical protein [Streptomyces sp. NPDC056512]|uniref:hypothetical protein n=1 Tax=Streptomyces sp. NPDC056512 TaxID=3345846 RepID=UPI0036BDBE69